MKRFWLAFVVVGAVGVMVAGCGQSGDPETGANEGFVCGKDGNTYSVEDAARGEHEVAHRGRCDEPMHCESTNDCFVGDDCRPAPSDWCVPGPTRCNCPGVFEPVCGGDHRTYINACEAACAGVGILHEGYCEEPPGDGCVRAGCSDHLCVEEGVDIASTCEWRPVYQCYQQATCERQQNGQCGFTPTHELVECLERFGEGMCYHDSDCPIGWICQQGILGSPQHEGVCERCGCLDIYMPVCGVDGRTYGNGCEARCAHVRVAYEGECKDDCPVETHIRNFQGECVPKCYGPEQCGDEQHCNAPDVCLQDPACPECDVCVGWCVLPAGDCRTNGCEPGWTCDYCQTADGPAWICLSPLAGACLPPDECRPTGCNGEICSNRDVASPCVALPEFACYQEVGICETQPWGGCGWTPTPELDECLSKFDCRSEGCGDGEYCTYCWVGYECIPEGAVC
jgi:coxsackievirus/adenovirus receptor